MDDLVSRQAVKDGMIKYGFVAPDMDVYEFVEDELPSIQPVTGKWIEKDGYDGDTYYDCSVCGESWTTIDGTPWDNGMKYCPNCGCCMEVNE